MDEMKVMKPNVEAIKKAKCKNGCNSFLHHGTNGELCCSSCGQKI